MAALSSTAATRGGASKKVSWVAVAVAAVAVAVPQLGLAAYALISQGSLTASGFLGFLSDPQFYRSLGLSVALAAATVVVLIAALVPAVVAVHLWAPKLSGVLSVVCTLPLVIPSIALVAGLMAVLQGLASQGRGSAANQLAQGLQNPDFPVAVVGAYVILALPFTYRSIDAALSAIPLRTYVEASESLGAGTWRTLAKVVAPNIRGSVIFSACFAFCLAIGEYTVAATMSVNTLPVYMATLSTTDFRASIALSLVSNIVTWGLLAFAMVYAGRFGQPTSGDSGSHSTHPAVRVGAPTTEES